MSAYFEGIMVLMFCAALFVLLLRFAKDNQRVNGMQRILVFTMWIGFILGTIGKFVQSANIILTMLYLAGTMLAYTAFLFSLPDKTVEMLKRRGGKGNE